MSKLGKFAAACAAVLCEFGAFGDVFLKPLGPDETREVQDGQSWATAYATVADAIANVESGVPIRAAKGVYVIPATITPVSKNVVIRGGYDGTSDAEPDPAANPTIFTGDQTLDDVWQHVEPVLGEFRYEKTDTETTVIGADGKVSDPGAFTDTFDGYAAKVVGTNTALGFSIGSGVSIDIDGVTFTGFTSHALSINAYDNETARLLNCVFAANRCPQGVVVYGYTGKSTGVVNSIKGCTFAYNYSTGNADGASCVHSQSLLTMTGCRFECCMSEGASAANCVNVRWSTPVIGSCTFCRCNYVTETALSTDAAGNGGPANLFAPRYSAGNFVFTNNFVESCLTMAKWSGNVPLVSYRASDTGFRHNAFVANRVEAQPAASSVIALLGSRTTDQKMVYGTSFVSNKVVAVSTTATSGKYVLAMVGCDITSARVGVVNCTFDGNEAIAPDAAGVTAVKCRGVAIGGFSATGEPYLGIGNCTFCGPDEPGQYDVAQVGDNLSKEVVLVNNIFMTDAERATPFYADSPDKFRLQNNTIKNYVEEAGMRYFGEGLETDEVPLVRSFAPFAGGKMTVFTPAARAPQLKTCCYLQCGNPGHYIFKSALSDVAYEGYTLLVPNQSDWRLPKAENGFLDCDQAGNARSSTDSMRGAINAYANGADEKLVLILRREPLDSGTFSPAGGIRAVGYGDTVRIMAVPNEGSSFVGWYAEDGEPFGESPTSPNLTIPSIDADLTLVAKFQSADVDLTFDLDGAGIFENGQDVITVLAQPGTPFPPVPAFTEDDEWVVKGWVPDFPTFVPKMAMTNTAIKLPKALRIIKCVPADEAGEVQDGTTWATAYGDLATAVADAGIYRGEVWLKKGLYKLSGSVALKSNVALRGGFAGEAENETPDPAANATIVSGDKNGDNKWTTGSTGYVWTDGVFNAPQLTSDVWYPNGNNSDDIGTGFSTPQAATNVVFAGLTFTGFKSAVLYSNDSKCDDLVFTNCSFFANTTGQANNDGTLHIIGSRFSVVDSRFVGNYHCLYLAATATRSAKATVTGTWFEGNSSKYGGAAVYIESSATLVATNCDFVAGWAYSDGWRCGPTISCYGSGSVTVDDCRFLRNQVRGGAMGVVVPFSGNTVKITRSRFVGNNCMLATMGQARAGGIFGQDSGSLFVKDCEISFNTNTVTAVGGSPRGGIYAGNGTTTFVNTTFDGNVHRVTSETEPVNAPFVNQGGKLAFVNCMVNGSAIDGNRPEVRLTGGQLCVINTAFENADADYAPVAATAAAQALVSHSFVRNFAAETVTLGTYGAITNVTAVGASRLHGPKAQDDCGNTHRGVKPFDRGRNVWLSGTVPYFHDPLANKTKPWRRADDLTSFAASVTGLTVDSPVLPDALGKARRNNHMKLGPVIVKSGLTVIVR